MTDANFERTWKRATLTAREGAEYLGISYWLMLELAKRHHVPAVHAGRRVLFRRESLDRWMAEQEATCTQNEELEQQYGKIRRIQ